MKVVIGLILDPQRSCFLLTQRGHRSSYTGFWEFPGGKLEAGEEPRHALERELREELGIECETMTFLGEFKYESTETELLVFLVSAYKGEPRCHEEQLALKWVEISTLRTYAFPPANKRLLEWLEESFVVPA